MRFFSQSFLLIALFLISADFQYSYSQQFTNSTETFGFDNLFNNSGFFGSGLSFYDFDNDGWDDITYAVNGDSIIMMRNIGSDFELMTVVPNSGDAKCGGV